MGLFGFLENFIQKILTFLRESIYSGHASHLIIGILIGAGIAIWTRKHTNSNIRSILAGIIIASTIGLFKEIVDPYLDRKRDLMDLIYTIIGGGIGALAILSVKIMAWFYPSKGQKRM